MSGIRTSVRWSVPFIWAAGMFAARFYDPSSAVAAAAAIATATVLATDAVRIRQLLRPTLRSIALGLIAAMAMVTVTYLLFPLLVHHSSAIGAMSTEIYDRFLSGRTRTEIVLFVIPLIFAEEILWRGAAGEAVRTKWPVLTVATCAAIYAISHAPLGSPLLVAVAFVCGLYWSGLRAFSGSLVPSLIAHLTWDLALILFPLVAHSGAR